MQSQGYRPSRDTWEPVSSLVSQINTLFMECVCRHKVQLQVTDLEALTQVIQASGN